MMTKIEKTHDTYMRFWKEVMIMGFTVCIVVVLLLFLFFVFLPYIYPKNTFSYYSHPHNIDVHPIYYACKHGMVYGSFNI